ncbi:hydantoinase/oxoprolinase family protein [Streptomyces sp. NPDC020845]|uniref:hydantoinase/oxoprolinase family protein n=1 Tax=Streptomyces sp. NPDC020845 TaxID=3365096 RepID=UPI00379A1BC8
MPLVDRDITDGYALGIDVGGTFTDIVLAGPHGQVAVTKCLSTHHDPTEGILRGVQSALSDARVAPAAVTRVVHATTLATNAILERRGVRVAYVTTQGFRSMLPLGRYARVEEDRYDIHFDPPAPPVEPARCFEVPERIDHRGSVLVPLEESAVWQVAEQIAATGADAVAVCLLHSYANPAHERRVSEILQDVLPPDTTVVASCDVWPELREYERATTTLMSAYVGPVMARYLRRLQSRLSELGIQAGVQVMESGGGVMSADLAGRRAVATIESGPAAGVISARTTGLAADRPDVISFDMGGTTAKACVIRDGRPDVTREFHVGGKGSFGGRRAGTGVPIKTPAIDLAEVGAGGGSIAWVDESGTLHVGPRSAGSQPGPACYGLGGDEPTVTDCNLVLGYLDPDAIAGGTLALRRDLAEQAVDAALAGPLGTDRAVAAHAVHEIANATMGGAVHVVTVQRGIDPRGFAVVAFGGAGPMHAARVAERFDIDTVIVPPSCGVGSAVGLLVTDLSTDRVLTRPIAHADADLDTMQRSFTDLAASAAQDLGVRLDGPDVEVHRSADVRFTGQAHELTVQIPGTSMTKTDLDEAADRFYEEYRRAYGIQLRGPVEFVSYRVRVTRVVPKVPVSRKPPAADAESACIAERAVWFREHNGYVQTPVYDRARLRLGDDFDGAAIVQDAESTIVVPPGWYAHIDAEANVVLTKTASRAEGTR